MGVQVFVSYLLKASYKITARWHAECKRQGMIAMIFCLSGIVIFTAWDTSAP
jgi:hypothetical protein